MIQRYLKRASGDYVIAVDWSQSTDVTADPNFNTETAYTDPNARVYQLKGNTAPQVEGKFSKLSVSTENACVDNLLHLRRRNHLKSDYEAA